MIEKEELKLLAYRLRVDTVLLLAGSLINLFILVAIGFYIGPLVEHTHTMTLENNRINIENQKILENFNSLLKKSRDKAK